MGHISLHSLCDRSSPDTSRGCTRDSKRPRQGSNQVFGSIHGSIPPGGFVEIDEEDLAKRKALTKLRVFAAGSFTNAVTFGVVLLLLFALFQTAPAGVLVTGFTPGSPAAGAQLPQWSVITGLNATTVTQIQDVANYMYKVNPGSLVQV